MIALVFFRYLGLCRSRRRVMIDNDEFDASRLGIKKLWGICPVMGVCIFPGGVSGNYGATPEIWVRRIRERPGACLDLWNYISKGPRWIGTSPTKGRQLLGETSQVTNEKWMVMCGVLKNKLQFVSSTLKLQHGWWLGLESLSCLMWDTQLFELRDLECFINAPSQDESQKGLLLLNICIQGEQSRSGFYSHKSWRRQMSQYEIK